jgi:hypothetical protein
MALMHTKNRLASMALPGNLFNLEIPPESIMPSAIFFDGAAARLGVRQRCRLRRGFLSFGFSSRSDPSRGLDTRVQLEFLVYPKLPVIAICCFGKTLIPD